MRILFVTKPHLPAVGGAQLTTHFLATELANRGHTVSVFAQQPPFDKPAPPRDTYGGYLVVRSHDTERDLPHVIDELSPDCVVVGGYHQEVASWTGAMLAEAAPLPTVLYAHDVGIALAAGERPLSAHAFASVSGFVAGELGKLGMASVVVPPIVDRSHYLVRTSRHVALFVNPVPKKGLDVVLSLAEARPDIPFAFVRCWYIAPEDLARLRARVDALANVEVRDSVHDPAQLYGDARLVLMPSTYPEAWGRVAAEAVAATIPVLGSAIGGLPEAIGDGGILVDPGEGAGEWIRQLGVIWDDATTYRHYVARAEAAGRRQHDVSAASVGAVFEALVAETVSSTR